MTTYKQAKHAWLAKYAIRALRLDKLSLEEGAAFFAEGLKLATPKFLLWGVRTCPMTKHSTTEHCQYCGRLAVCLHDLSQHLSSIKDRQRQKKV